MPDKNNNLYLFEALELRREYSLRISNLKEILPENRNKENRYLKSSNERFVPVKELNIDSIRKELSSLKTKKRKLNMEIQNANLTNKIEVDGEEIEIYHALDYRKELSEDIKELGKQLKETGYKKIIYKNDRDIEEKPELSYKKVKNKLDKKIKIFREINRKLKKAQYKIVINYKDEND